MRSAAAEADKPGLPPRVPAGAVPRYLLSEESVAGVPAVPLPREGGQACAVPHAHGRHRRDMQHRCPRVPAALLWPHSLQTRGPRPARPRSGVTGPAVPGEAGMGMGMCPALNQVKPQQDAWLQDSLGLGPEAPLMVEMWLCPAGTPCVGTVPWCHSSTALPWHLSVLGNESKTPVTQGSHSPPLIFQWGLGFACPPPPLPSSCWLSWDLGI